MGDISREMLKPGDHICTERWKGIYVGDDLVIHVNGPRKQCAYSAMKIKSIPSATNVCPANCQNNEKGFMGGTIKTCLDCSLDGHSLYVYDYECYIVRQHIEQNGGSIKLPEEVIEFANGEL